jgi:hypothetical protein
LMTSQPMNEWNLGEPGLDALQRCTSDAPGGGPRRTRHDDPDHTRSGDAGGDGSRIRGQFWSDRCQRASPGGPGGVRTRRLGAGVRCGLATLRSSGTGSADRRRPPWSSRATLFRAGAVVGRWRRARGRVGSGTSSLGHERGDRWRSPRCSMVRRNADPDPRKRVRDRAFRHFRCSPKPCTGGG